MTSSAASAAAARRWPHREEERQGFGRRGGAPGRGRIVAPEEQAGGMREGEGQGPAAECRPERVALAAGGAALDWG